MSSDKSLGLEKEDFAGTSREPREVENGASFSGNERNRLFLSSKGESFTDISGLSGLDHPGDSRAFAILDYDRDGWQDIVLVNANAPLLQLFRNQIGDQTAEADQGRTIALRLVGGNHAAEPSGEWSARDGYGAKVTVITGDFTILREHRAGEGLAAQNSATLLIGIGRQAGADSVVVQWPSGKVQEIGSVPAGTLLTVYENPAHSPGGSAFVSQPYTDPSQALSPRYAETPRRYARELRLDDGQGNRPQTGLVMYTTMATWCVACREEIPQLNLINSAFDGDTLKMIGVPIDQAEGPELLQSWLDANQPPYQLASGLDSDDVARVDQIIVGELGLDGVPVTIVTDGEGQVLLVRWGPPTVSDLRKLLWEEQQG